MGRRTGGLFAAALMAAQLAAPLATAGNPFPAVDLPASTPDAVRDATARSMAATRDALGWAVHPFRGEFHGLGAPEGTYSQAYDLSANGRVVVGENYADIGREAFVWTPWTGNATYEMRPAGVVGSASAQLVSADGVYVTATTKDNSGHTGVYRWSLAGTDRLVAPEDRELLPYAMSADGSEIVGSAQYRDILDYFTLGLGNAAVGDTDYVPFSIAFSYDASNGMGVPDIPDLDVDLQHTLSYASGISSDGLTILMNVTSYNDDLGSFVSEPYLIDDDGAWTRLSSAAQQIPLPSHLTAGLGTSGRQLSASDNAVVGTFQTEEPEFVRYLSSGVVNNGVGTSTRRRVHAAIWRNDDGWIDLGNVPLDQTGYAMDEYPTGVSSDGSVIVGNSSVYYSSRYCDGDICSQFQNVPFLWDEQRGMRDVSDVLRLDYGLDLGGWTLGRVTGISDDGTTIIGNGYDSNGRGEAWRAVLHRNTPHGDIDFDGDVDHHDYQTLAGNLGLDSDSSAVFYADGDLNADGRVDEVDKMALLGLMVPEPSAAWLLATGCAAADAGRRRSAS